MYNRNIVIKRNTLYFIVDLLLLLLSDAPNVQNLIGKHKKVSCSSNHMVEYVNMTITYLHTHIWKQ